MTERKKPTPRDVTYTGDRVRMTDKRSVQPEKPTEPPSGPAPEQPPGPSRTDDTTERLERVKGQLDRMTDHDLAAVLEFDADLRGEAAGETLREAARRLRARQREEGEGDEIGCPRCDWSGDKSDTVWRQVTHGREQACPKCDARVLLRRDATPQREGEREPYRRQLRSALLDLWRDAEGCPHCCNRESVERAFRLLRQRTEPPAERETDEAITLECSECEAAVEVPIEGDLLRIGTHATGWTITRDGGFFCPSHPASATPNTEEDET